MTEFPVSYAQESLVGNVTESAINVPAVVPVHGPLDVARVQRVVDALVRRHGALRTDLHRTETGLVHRIADEASLPVAVTRHRGTTLRAALPALLLAGSERPFALLDSALARAELHSFAPRGAADAEEQVLVIWLHHLIGDLVSSQVLAAEARTLWEDRELGGPLAHVGHFAAYERAQALSDGHARYWQRVLDGADDEVGIGYPDGTPHQARRPALPRLPVPMLDALSRLASAHRTTLTAVLASAVVATHLADAAADRMVFGLTVSNREHPQLRGVVGCLADQVPVVVDVSGRPSFAELLHRVRGSLMDAYEHRVPLGLLLPLLRRQSSPVFAVNLNFLPPTAGVPLAAPDAVTYGLTKSRAEPWWLGDAGLAYRPRVDGGGLAGEIEGDAHLHSAAQVAAFGERFGAVLRAAALDPGVDARQAIYADSEV